MAKSVLIVDDASFMRTILKGILERAGYEIAGEAGDGQQAIDLFKDLRQVGKKPDLIIMDITMAGMDGISALKEFKKIDPNIIVVMCSALTGQDVVIDAIRSGAKNFIAKPFDEGKVVEAIYKAMPK